MKPLFCVSLPRGRLGLCRRRRWTSERNARMCISKERP